jgi:hypothetical protein
MNINQAVTIIYVRAVTTLAVLALLVCAVALACGPARADDDPPAISQSAFKQDPACQQSWWYQICRNDDGSTSVCGMRGPGCETVLLPGGRVPEPIITPGPAEPPVLVTP